MKNLRLRLRGISVLLRIAITGLRDEPAHFIVMLSRRLSSIDFFLKFTSRIETLFGSRYLANFSGSRRLHSAIDLLNGRPTEAINRVIDDHTPYGCLARARAEAFLGNFEIALSLAQNAGRRGRRLATLYASEVEVFTREPSERSSALNLRSNSRVVLFFITNSLPFTNSGYTQRTHSVLKSISNVGWNVIPYTRLGYPWIVGQLPDSESSFIEGIEYRRLLTRKLPETHEARVDLQTQELVRVAQVHRPELLHTTTEFMNGLSVAAAAAHLNIPWVYEVRGQLADTWLSGNAERKPDSYKYKYFKAQEAAVAKCADAVITLGEAMRSELIKSGVEPARIIVCPNAVGAEFTENLPDKVECRKFLGLSEELLYIGTVSSLVGYEGLDLLVRAFAALSFEYPNLRLLIVGDGSERQALIQLCDELGVGDRVVFPGRVKKVLALQYHRALDVFVVPRRNLEVTRVVTPLKPVEALAFEVPVVAADLPALREIVTDGIDGLLFEPEDESDLADKLRLLLRQPCLRASMGRKGREKVLQTRTWAKNAQNIAKLYDALLVRE